VARPGGGTLPLKTLRLILLSGLAALVVVAACLSDLPLLPARRGTFTLLCTGNVEGHLLPCSD